MIETIKEGSEKLKVSVDHTRRMIKLGRWPFYRLGIRAIRIDPEEIQNLGRLIAEKEKVQIRK
jgi:excisionase family DNA binding protein